MSEKNTIQKLMTQNVISVTPDTPLTKAAEILVKYNFNGLPVVTEQNRLVGIITEYDLMIKGSSIHLPTLLKLLGEFDVYSKDKKFIKGNLRDMLSMQVKDVMDIQPKTLSLETTIEDAVKFFGENRDVNPVPIIDQEGKLAGIISRYDIVKLFSGPTSKIDQESSERELDKNINQFVSSFGKRFVFVSKLRIYYWLQVSILFVLVGFLIAFALMVIIRKE